MDMTEREIWALFHGVLFGGAFLLAFAGGLAGLWSFRTGLVTPEGIRERLRRLQLGVWSMAVLAWFAVMTGTYVVYPWYRAKPPEGTTDLSGFPRSLLLSDPNTDLWHKFAFEWKEHIAFVTPILATAVAVLVTYYGTRLVTNDRIRWTLMGMFVAAFAAAAIAGGFGALVTKVAPVQ
jgi:energy-converting hydrogenase Eha subunit A